MVVVQSLRRFVRVIPCIYVMESSPKGMGAVIFKANLMCYAFLESALKYIVKIWAADAQD